MRHAHSDLVRSIDHVLGTFPDIADKAIEIVKLNGLVVSILVAASTQVEDPMMYTHGLVYISAILFFISSLFGLIGYLFQNVVAGLGTHTRLIEMKLTEEEYLQWVINDQYDDWLQEILKKQRRKALYVQVAVITFVLAISTFFIGIFLSMN